MQSEVIPQPSYARCYICNQSENIEQVCHHCGRSICQEHAINFRWIGFMIRNREFKDLGLDKSQETPLPVHCKNCLRDSFAYWFFFVASIICFLGCGVLLYGILLYYHVLDEIVFTVFNTYAIVDQFRPVTVISASLWILVAGFLFYTPYFWYWSTHSKEQQPSFPVVPAMDSIKIVESMKGSVHLDEQGKYKLEATHLEGKFTAPIQFVLRDRKRWKRYLTSHRLTHRPSLPLQAGFVVFKEAENIKFEKSPHFTKEQINTFMIHGQVGDHPFLTDTALTNPRQWEATLPYTIDRSDHKKIPLPIQIIPSLVQDDTQRSIGLAVQFSPQFAKQINKFEKAIIKELTLLAPNDLSKVLLTNPPALLGVQIDTSGPDEIQKLKVTWSDVDFDLTQDWTKNFTVQFSNPIQQTTRLSGNLKIDFTGTFSGLKNVGFFYPWGQKYTKVKTDFKAAVDIDFELSLESLHFQQLYPKAGPHPYEYVLNHALISKLTQRLEHNKFYVRRVIENPACTDPADARIINRFWDLAGRYYEGVYPIDFHLVFTGAECLDKPNESRMKVDFNVQAVVTSEPLRTKVDRLHESLLAIVEDTIKEN